MSLRNSIAKLYIRVVFREDGPFDPLKTQAQLNAPDPPKKIAPRCERVDHPVRAYWIDRQNSGNGVLVYLHGGAFYFGPVKEHWEYFGTICKMSGMAGILVDHGIAPQSTFPKPLNEIVELVSDIELPDKWFFLGDSSGAAMAVSATFKLREMNARLPTGFVLMSPWIDATLENTDIKLNESEDPMMTAKRLLSSAKCYAPDADLKDPLISPMFGDVTGLPAMLVQMGTSDLLLWDCRKFVEKCRDEGVDVTYQETPNAFHDFMMLSFLPEAKKAIGAQIEFLTR